LEIELKGGARVFGLHLSARFSKWSEARRVREIGALLESIKEHQEGFHVLCGDFNTLAPDEILDTSHFPLWIKALVWVSGRDIKRDTVRRPRVRSQGRRGARPQGSATRGARRGRER
jgi:exodeoxyribonuclease-3